ncbi:MAG: hypothetical protein UD936_07715 [Acutalibacteraceae bacterium]|nr:hypothetical protein [Acutalibacteraceae bacterium]
MKIIKKSAAVALCALMAGSALTGCTQATVFGKYPNDYSWSYKDETSTLPIGGYILYEYMAFNDASTKLNVATGDFLGLSLKDDDGKSVTAKNYISAKTDESCKHYLYVNKVFKDMGLKLTPQEVAAYKANTDSTWTQLSTSLEAMGISKDSFVKTYGETSAKLQSIFKATYTEGGPKEIKMDELKKHYTENYVNYSYFSVPLYTEVPNEEDGSVATTKLSADDIKAVKADLQKYADDVNGGKTYDDAVKAYMADYTIEADPTLTATNILDKSGLPEDVITALEGMKDKEAKYIVVGEDGEAPLCYFIYKGDIQNEAKNLETNEDVKLAVISEMKNEEFEKDMLEGAKAHKCQKNDAALAKYPAEMFIVEAETEPATEPVTEVFTGVVE